MLTALVIITKKPPTTPLTILESEILQTDGWNTTRALLSTTNEYRIMVGVFLPNESIHTPMNGEANSSMDAEIDESIDRIWIACDCGDLDDDTVSTSFDWTMSVKYRVMEGRGENATIDMDTTMRNEVWWRAFNVMLRCLDNSFDDTAAAPPPLNEWVKCSESSITGSNDVTFLFFVGSRNI